VPDEEERLDIDEEVHALNAALRLQYRSALQYTLAAASVTGFELVTLGDQMFVNARDDLADARRLIEKITSLGGEPTAEIAAPTVKETGDEMVAHLIEIETECVDALQDAIAPTGREGRSEALEHRLEHMIMRKQEAIDFLLRASRRTG
jgi:bacterioferritin (cytochrome b1)